MAENVLDLDLLLAPLAEGDGGAGVDLRTDYSPASPYQKLRDARADARAEERAQDSATGDETPAPPQAWRDVKRLALQCLAEKSKDFEVAAWLCEAVVRIDGLPGLAAAAALIEGLAEKYWEPGFPQPDEDGMEVRSSPIGGLAGADSDGTIMQALRRMPLFRNAEGKTISLHLWQAAEDVAAIGDAARQKARLAAGVPVLTDLENAARAAMRDLRNVGVAARATNRAWASMTMKLDDRFGSSGPSTRRVTELLERVQQIGERIAGALPEEVLEAEAMPEEAAAEVPEAATAAGGAPAAGPRPLRTREDAIRQLEELAAWFHKTEPHSPLAYTLNDAVRRARLPLPELLAEVLTDEKARATMLTMLGIRSLEGPAG